MVAKKTPVLQGEQLTLEVVDLNHDGEGVGKTKSGFTVFVPGALPMEEVRVKIDEAKKRFARGRVLETVMTSPHRVAPPCPYFGDCGGCQLQHLTYEQQLIYKEKVVSDALKKIGGVDSQVAPVIGMDEPWFYRNKFQIPVGTHPEHPNVLGLFQQKSNEIVPLDRCLIQQEANNETYRMIRDILRAHRIQGYDRKTHKGLLRHIIIRSSYYSEGVHVTLVTTFKDFPGKKDLVRDLSDQIPNLVGIDQNINYRITNQVLSRDFQNLWGNAHLKDQLLSKTFQISSGAFYQVNPVQTEVLYQKILDISNVNAKDRIVDLYCGIGTIGIVLSERAKSVLGVEVVPDAVTDAEANISMNGVENMSVRRGHVGTEGTLKKLKDFNPNVVVVDPPRKGCEQELIDSISKISPDKLIYVSCDPATLARDINQLCSHDYKVKHVQPIDMFPQTVHVECVVLIEKK